MTLSVLTIGAVVKPTLSFLGQHAAKSIYGHWVAVKENTALFADAKQGK